MIFTTLCLVFITTTLKFSDSIKLDVDLLAEIVQQNIEIIKLNNRFLKKQDALTEENKQLKERIKNIEAEFKQKAIRRVRRQATTFNQCSGVQGPPGPPGLTIQELEAFYKNLKHPTVSSSHAGGATYIRWGRTTCGSDAIKLYEGTVGGSYWSQKGGGANYLCLHDKPEWGNFSTSDQKNAYIFGAEYEGMDRNNLFKKTNAQNLQNQDVPCAACHSVKRAAKIMIPGRRSCNPGWTKEYEGYLVTERNLYHESQAVFECLDNAPEVIRGSHGNTNGAIMYVVQTRCDGGSLCPNYIQWREVTCVVCTK